ncbi:Gfo/Idh/MocA family oxidoreductase [Candidatus Bathyarchaeota archaeon]|nr:Gfo/Idh/MocA family oxidoreductase [Candidatus Bathyarchaeota archaeon]
MGISLGLVGLGMFGSMFIELFMKHPDVERLAICDVRKDRLEHYAKKYDIAETYSSLDEICQSDIEALAIFTQHWLHGPHVLKALKEGKHVLSAVPMAYSIDECISIVNMVKETGLIYMMGETSYFRPESIFCRKKAEKGEFGEFIQCRAEYFHDVGEYPHGLWRVLINRWGDLWSLDKTGDPPMWYPSHSICFPVSVMKAHMVEVSALGYIYPNDDFFRVDTIYRNPFCNETALFKMSNGAVAIISEFRRIGGIEVERVSGIYGTEGSFESNLAGAVWADKRGKGILKPEELKEWQLREPLPESLRPYVNVGHEGAEAYIVHEFVDSVNSNRLPRINAWEAARYCIPGFIAHQSALSGGRWFKIPDLGEPPAYRK